MKKIGALAFCLALVSCLKTTPSSDDESPLKKTKVSTEISATPSPTAAPLAKKKHAYISSETGKVTYKTMKSEPLTIDIINGQPEGQGCTDGSCYVHNDPLDDIDLIRHTLNENVSPLAGAAQKYLVSLYQSCDVLSGVGKHKKGQLERDNKLCIEPKVFPKYLWNAKPQMKNYEVTTKNNSIDCSGFLIGSLTAAGMKIFPTDSDKIDEESNPILSTQGLGKLGANKDCFEVPYFTADEQIRSGDVINWRYGKRGHVVIITEVGEDPFGINHLNKDSCDRDHIDPQNFNFKMAQSLGVQGTGPTQETVAGMLEKRALNARVISRFVALAIEACLGHFKGKIPAVAHIDGEKFKVLRHVGDANPSCVAKEIPSITGDQCYESCFDGDTQ